MSKPKFFNLMRITMMSPCQIAISRACTEANLQEEFFPRESAYERRNRNAPWYCRFDRKRRR